MVYSKEFFENLGKLFFAIAACDKTIKEEESIKLFTIIETDWKQAFNKKDCNLILNTFKILGNSQANPDESFDDFFNFKKDNTLLFTKTIKDLILETSGQIASSFSNKNKSELILLAKLNLSLRDH